MCQNYSPIPSGARLPTRPPPDTALWLGYWDTIDPEVSLTWSKFISYLGTYRQAMRPCGHIQYAIILYAIAIFDRLRIIIGEVVCEGLLKFVAKRYDRHGCPENFVVATQEHTIKALSHVVLLIRGEL